MRVPTSLAARVGAVVAAAAFAVTGATAVASASTAPAAHASRIPTTLTISVAAPVTHKHVITDVVTGQLTAGSYNLRGLPVWLARQGPKGHWHLVRSKLTKRQGYVVFRVAFKKSATIKLVFRGTKNFARSHSATVTVS